MSQLKPSFVKDIFASLESARFTGDDFTIDLPKSGRVLAKITFKHKADYGLVLTEEDKEDQVTIKTNYDLQSRTERRRYTSYFVKMIPGEFKTEAVTEVDSPGDLLRMIPQWCDHIRTDLYALAPRPDPIEELRKKLEADVDRMVDEPGAYFSEKEIQAVDTRFDELFAKISEMREQFLLTKQQLELLQREFAEFKQSARVYPKGLWAKITSNKLVKATGRFINTPEGRQFLFQQLRRAIGGDGA